MQELLSHPDSGPDHDSKKVQFSCHLLPPSSMARVEAHGLSWAFGGRRNCAT